MNDVLTVIIAISPAVMFWILVIIGQVWGSDLRRIANDALKRSDGHDTNSIA